MADSVMQLAVQVEGMVRSLPGLIGTPLFKLVTQFLHKVNPYLPQGGPTAGVKQTIQSQNSQDTLRNAAQQKLAMLSGGQTMPGAESPGPVQQPGPAAPVPQMPLPGV